MQQRTKKIIIGVAVIQLALIMVLPAVPYIIENYVPGEYWSYLPHWLIDTMGARQDFVSAAGIEPVEVDAAALVSVINTAEPSPTPLLPTPTTQPEATKASSDETAAPTAEPMPTQPPPTPTSSPTPEPLPVAYRLPDLNGTNIEAQKFNNCGPTNLSLVLRHYGADISQLDVAAYLKPNSQDRNVSPWQISDYVNEQTVLRSITRSNGTQELLKRLITADFPVVIEKGYDPVERDTSGWYGHYLTVFGYDDDKGEYYTLDTFLGPFAQGDVKAGYSLEDGHPYSYDYVGNYWQQFNYTFYVVYPPSRESELFNILGPDLLDDVKMWQGAAKRAQVDIEANGENAFAWFNLGTALTHLGELTGDENANYYENGALAFDKARAIGLPSRMMWYQHRPYIAYMKTGRYQDMLDLANSTLQDPGGRNVEETYYYKGHAQSLLGDLNGAAASFQKALELNKYFYPAQIALDYVNSIR